MKLLDLKPPVIELAPGQTWYRIQRIKAMAGSVRTHGLVLAPAGTPVNRFDLVDEPTAYLADSEVTAAYETVFRREKVSYPLEQLRLRAMTTFTTTERVRLVDLRGLEERYPVLMSLRYDTTRAFAAEARQANVHGVLYSSAQHPHHSCVCMFQTGFSVLKRLLVTPLVKPGRDVLHRAVVQAAYGSQVPIV